MHIGFTGYNHESSAALVDSKGKLLDYYREESLSRIKGDKCFPKRSLKRLLRKNSLSTKEINSITFYERPLLAYLNPIKIAAAHIPDSLGLLSHQFRNFNKSSLACYLDISSKFPGLENKLIYMDHHLSHTINALSYSNSKNNLCSIVVDGFGDNSTASISKINNLNDIRELWSCEYPASVGLFYSAITDFLGFQVNEGEYKVMGLSAFGESNTKLAKDLGKIFKWDSEKNMIIQDMDYFNYHISSENSYGSKLEEILGKPRNPFIPLKPKDNDFQKYANIAKATQDITVQVLCGIFELAHKLTGNRVFLFSGGVAMNSASLDKIAEQPFIDELIVPPDPSDSGSAIGAAFYGYIQDAKTPLPQVTRPSLFPSLFQISEQIEVSKEIIEKDFLIIEKSKEKVLPLVAKLISEGEIIGTILENSETGPRALGNRSLICDGKNSFSVKKLNTVIKNRSPFRPTAPCMRVKTAFKYYELKKELMNCYLSMNATCKCKKNSPSNNFPTTHVDGTARIQIIEDTSILEQLFKALETYKIDILANSSLNISGDPTCFDLIDGLMVSSLNPLEYLWTDIGLLKKK